MLSINALSSLGGRAGRQDVQQLTPLGHNGGDPGLRTTMSFRPADGVGVIVFVNRAKVDLAKINERLFREATRI